MREIGDCRPFDPDSGVAPRGNAARRIARPTRRDAQAGHEPEAAIDDEALAVIPPEPRERRPESERVEPPQLQAGLPQARPEVMRTLASCAEPVLKHPDAYAAP